MNDRYFQPFRSFTKFNMPLIFAKSRDWKPSTLKVFLYYADIEFHGRIIDNASINRETCDFLRIHSDTLKAANQELKASEVILAKKRGYLEINGIFAYKGTHITGQHPYRDVSPTEEMEADILRYHSIRNRQFTAAFNRQYSEAAMYDFLRNDRANFVPMSIHLAALREKEMLIEDWKRQHEKIMQVQDEHLKLIHEIRAELRKHDPEKAEVFRLKLVKNDGDHNNDDRKLH